MANLYQLCAVNKRYQEPYRNIAYAMFSYALEECSVDVMSLKCSPDVIRKVGRIKIEALEWLFSESADIYLESANLEFDLVRIRRILDKEHKSIPALEEYLLSTRKNKNYPKKKSMGINNKVYFDRIAA